MEFLFSSFGKILHYNIHKKLQKYFRTPVLTPVKCVVIWSPHLILHSYSRVSNKAWHRCLNYLTHYQWWCYCSVFRVCHFAKSLRINWVSLPQIKQNKYFRQIDIPRIEMAYIFRTGMTSTFMWAMPNRSVPILFKKNCLEQWFP